MADFWMYSDIEPLSVKYLLLDSAIPGRPFPNEKKYISAKWQDDCTILATITVGLSKTILGTLTEEDIEKDINRALDKAWGKDLPDITWDIKISQFEGLQKGSVISQFDVFIDMCD